MGHDSKSYITQVPTSRNSFLRCGVKQNSANLTQVTFPGKRIKVHSQEKACYGDLPELMIVVSCSQ